MPCCWDHLSSPLDPFATTDLSVLYYQLPLLMHFLRCIVYLSVLLLPLRLGCLFRPQATEAEVVAVERRIQEQVKAANAAKAQLAAAQLVCIYYRHCTAQTRRAAAA